MRPAMAVAISAGKERRSSPFGSVWVDTTEGFGKASPCNEEVLSVTYLKRLRDSP